MQNMHCTVCRAAVFAGALSQGEVDSRRIIAPFFYEDSSDTGRIFQLYPVCTA